MSSLQQYIHFQYDDAHQLLISTWNTTADMTDEEYRQVAIEYLKACEKYRPKYSLVDGRNAAYIIPLDIQEWLNGYIYPKCIDAGICKLAFLVVKDLYTQISLEFGVCGLCNSDFLMILMRPKLGC
jgi:hypothetical protein